MEPPFSNNVYSALSLSLSLSHTHIHTHSRVAAAASYERSEQRISILLVNQGPVSREGSRADSTVPLVRSLEASAYTLRNDSSRAFSPGEASRRLFLPADVHIALCQRLVAAYFLLQYNASSPGSDWPAGPTPLREACWPQRTCLQHTSQEMATYSFSTPRTSRYFYSTRPTP